MQSIVFVGLGVMGLPMAQNLLENKVEVLGCDVNESALSAFRAFGATAAKPEEVDFSRAHAIVSMLPSGQLVQELMETQVFARAAANALIIDCSTIGVETTRDLAEAAQAQGFDFIDAPVSGGNEAARQGKLSFMLGGTEAAIGRAAPLLDLMGSRRIHFGPSGSGQAAKACHNMICGITAIGVCEGFALSEALGLDQHQFFDLCRNAAAQSWTLENRCPVPNVAPNTPASNSYAPGFAARLMAKDLRLAAAAAAFSGQGGSFWRASSSTLYHLCRERRRRAGFLGDLSDPHYEIKRLVADSEDEQ